MMSSVTSPTIVISVRGRDRASLLSDPNFVYVGRRCAGWPESKWGNPFKVVGHVTRPLVGGGYLCTTTAEALAKYAAWLGRKPQLLERLPELKSRVLGCWCVDWDGGGEPERPCHAVLLARLADGAGLTVAPEVLG